MDCYRTLGVNASHTENKLLMTEETWRRQHCKSQVLEQYRTIHPQILVQLITLQDITFTGL